LDVQLSSRRLLIAGIAAGLVIRIVLLLGTFGTTDIVIYSSFARMADQHGVGGSYDRSSYLKNPPLVIALAMQIYRLSERTGLAFGDLFRLVQIFADLGSSLCLLVLARKVSARPEVLSLLFFLSPATIFISAFHGNADPTMIFLVLLSIALLAGEKDWSVASGVAVAIAMGLKTVPLLLVPLYCIFLGRRSWRFLAGFALTAALIFGIPAAYGGGGLLRNVFGYRGLGNWWGIVSILTAIQRWTDSAAAQRIAELFIAWSTLVVALLIASLGLILWRRLDQDRQKPLRELLGVIGAAFAAMVFLAPGFGVQYLLWSLPFLPFIIGIRQAVAIHALASAFLAIVYTRWSGGLPWWFADSDRPGVTTDLLVYFGWLVWASLGYVAIAWMIRTRRE
jgi:hypothetical protein